MLMALAHRAKYAMRAGVVNATKRRLSLLAPTRPSHGTFAPLRSVVSSAAATEQAVAPSSSTAAAAAAAPPTANVVAILRSRGLVQEVTSDELERAALATRLSVYCGFDPTADSLHLGNLLGIVVLAWFQRCGHEAVALVGGATGRVGDPSGRSSERPVLSEEAIERNVAGIRRLLTAILERSTAAAAAADSAANGTAAGAGGVRVLNNLDWFGPMSFLGFLRDVGKHARVGAMLAKDSVRSRMESESGISFTEFAYQLLQGYDFVHLCREHGVRVQIGGSDQWGNITAGTDLIRRLLGNGGAGDSLASADGSDAGGSVASTSSSDASTSSTSTSANGSGSSSSQDGGGNGNGAAPACYGLTFPLLVDSEGRKFGKSTGGAVWLSAERLSPYKFYQHLFAVADADVIKLLRMLTFLPLEEIDAIEASMKAPGYQPNTAQRRLAEAVTEFVHGPEGLATALRATEALRPGGDTKLDAAALEAIAGDAPTCALARADVEGKPLTDVIVAAKLLPSKGEARRMAKNGGLYLNNVKVADDARVVGADDLIDGRLALLAAGKKNKLLLRVE